MASKATKRIEQMEKRIRSPTTFLACIKYHKSDKDCVMNRCSTVFEITIRLASDL